MQGVGLIGYEAINVVDSSVAAYYGLSSVTSMTKFDATTSLSLDAAKLSYQVSPFKK